MIYLTEPLWVVGKPGNGNRDIWQCPDGCEKNVDYSGADPKVQFPRGDRTHVKAGRPIASRGWQSFHQGDIFEPERVAVVNGKNHIGVNENLLRLTGGTLTEQHQAMVVRRFDQYVDWKPSSVVRLTTWFKPSTEGYPDYKTAKSRLFSNIEFRGERTEDAIWGANNAIGVFLKGDNIFIMYWSETTEPANMSTILRYDFNIGVIPDMWHKLSMSLVGQEEPNTWLPKVTIRRDGKDLIRWVGKYNVKKMKKIHTFALGDERPNDNYGGRFYWEKIKVVN